MRFFSLLILFLTSLALPVHSQIQPCFYKAFSIKNDSLKLLLNKYIGRVENDALPLLGIKQQNDTSYIYLSATISANSIKNSPPSYLTKIGNRDVAVYTGSEHVFPMDSECLSELVNRCRKKLQIDKQNAINGKKEGTKNAYFYDPIWVKITYFNGQVVGVNDKGEAIRAIPYFKFSF